MASKRISKKTTTKGPNLTMEAYKDYIDKENTANDPVDLKPINSQDEYSLSPTYKIINNSLAYYPFDKSGDSFFLEKPEVDLSMWFESKKSLIIWSLVKNEFLSWMNKVQKVKAAS